MCVFICKHSLYHHYHIQNSAIIFFLRASETALFESLTLQVQSIVYITTFIYFSLNVYLLFRSRYKCVAVCNELDGSDLRELHKSATAFVEKALQGYNNDNYVYLWSLALSLFSLLTKCFPFICYAFILLYTLSSFCCHNEFVFGV